ncbi:helix-turn-helix transcriptional regulator [Bythopirellula goksoeyrii]|uniref:Helix-turn-helix domain protein n=1 Tax=Bythopirellula goksoeyrii TaxID=1400387 RepID=A0A5B9Q7U7_9BACT|nr:helix-turn-helix domain-containing protein [Bythopirellula goksoeyrii]QEG35114.1 Helix-turn-helix domain protein [Bythopirellula goksoeyrii]
MSSKSPTILLTRRQVAEAMNLSERYVFTLTKRGVLPQIRLGRSVRYRVKDVEKATSLLIAEQQDSQGGHNEY